MRITKQDINEAVKADVFDEATGEKLWTFLVGRTGTAGRPRFDLTNLLWYAGALIVISAMGLFSTEAFSRWGGDALAITAMVYGVLFVAAGHYFWRVRNIRVLGGLLVTVAVSMAPLATYGVQDHLGWWSHGDPGNYHDFFVWVRGSWVFMSLSAIVAGAVALNFYKFPFITMIMAFALWFLSMDLTPWLISNWPGPSDEIQAQIQHWQRLAELRGIISTLFGLGLILIAWFFDLRGKSNFTFWPHLAAGLSINGGMYYWLTDSGYEWATLCAISLALLLLSIFLQRRAYAVFGAIGVASYLGYLSNEVFKDAILFSFALTGIGILIMVIGYYYFKHEQGIETWVESKLPDPVKQLRPQT